MPIRPIRTLCGALLALALCGGARADLVGSSASIASVGSTSVGSLSDSVRGSSDSSSRGNKVAEGEYRVLAVAPHAERPGVLRLTLQAADPTAGSGGELRVDLPQQALAARGLAAGDRVQVRHRAYGLAFAHTDTREAFFLALEDGWLHELRSVAVTL